MNAEIKKLLNQIHELEEEIEHRFDELRKEFHYSIQGRKVQFEKEVKRLHHAYRTGLLQYLSKARPLHILTAPVIYSMVIPIAFFDLSLSLYQQICFRAYGIKRVSRKEFIIIDRHRLAYLNMIEKLNCVYCGYGNGVVAYAREIIARTEQYWCPIKHAQRVVDGHDRYQNFFEFGDPETFRLEKENKRNDLRK